MMNCKTISKQCFVVLLSLIMLFSLAACGTQSGNQDSNDSQPENSGVTEPMPSSNNGSSESENTETDNISSDEASANSNILVAYFSRTGENYNVGVIEKGNTHIIAEMIAEETGADIFEIQPVNPYPDTYDECTDVAREEQNENARPKIVGSVDNMEQYDMVFIGYPIWWGDLPMVVYTFLESYDFSGKTIIPFCTHEGSGLSGTDRNIASACPSATVLDGLAIRGSVAQNNRDEAKSDVLEWLDRLEY